jgi:hypothetical protein
MMNIIPLYISHFLNQFIGLEHLGGLYSLPIVNIAAINMGVKVCLWSPDLHSFQHMPKSDFAQSNSNSIFSFLRNLHIAFHSGCANSYSHQ